MYVSMSNIPIVVAALAVGAVSACILTFVLTTIQFHLDVWRQHKQEPKPGERPVAITVPLKPHALPVLGSTTFGFFSKKIGRMWNVLLQECARWDLKAISVLLAGTRTHILFKPASILSEFREKKLTRQKQARLLATNVLGMTYEQAVRTFPDPPPDPKTQVTLERVHAEFLLTPVPTTTMTNKFMECFLDSISKQDDSAEVSLYAWIKEKLFEASVIALFGSELLRMYPDLHRDFWVWERNLMTLLFGTPKFLARDAFEARENMLDKLESWLAHGYKHTSERDDAVEWEPYFGAKVMRKRHEYYQQQGLTLRSQAGKEMIFLAGILSNAIPTIGWLLTHLFSPTSPPDLLPKITEEVKRCQDPASGALDIAALTRLPLLNSTANEVLRLYMDLLIIRQVDSDAVLDNIPVRRGEQTMASSWMAHRHPDNFPHPDRFQPERFLRKDAEKGTVSCSISGLGGKYFPFGGGHHMCPGRNFARQEIVGTVAVILLNFDVEFVSFVDANGTPCAEFPKMIDALPGNQVMGLKGDTRVRITKKRKN
ncbi:cytochrome P450 [Podospora australis]|uniref:Cytochrome P450 n=1 Tax=Podospora australis TaxID=1536484 RepID=A0AAN6WQF9_9PEZI|nr:cytochrome P450 [Podospora australis]